MAGKLDVLYQLETESEPDVILFSRVDTSVFVAGTYHLDESRARNGALLLYHLSVASSPPW
jgi:hypothetical protein